jgi:CubicO group peptidase (beta-lactamase class C family)
MIRRSHIVLAALLAACGSSLHAQAARGVPDLRAFDAYVEQAVRDWRVPGLAIAVVKDDSVVLAKGYGVLELGRPERVTEHTRFAIGSTTKAMTAAAIAMLVDEGKLRLDDRIIDLLPDFRLYDPYVTRELTIRDVLLHRSGLGSTDLLWAFGEMPFGEMMRRLRHVRPVSSFRSQWTYQNVMYALAGEIVAKVSGMSWAEFTRVRIFAPLGMSESVPLVSEVRGRPNVATPHDIIRDTVRPVPMRSTDGIASAGSVYSSVSDMAKWMRFMLDSARVGGKQLLQPATFSELVTPQIRAGASTYPALTLSKPHGFSYGLGWFVQDYQGEVVWMHTGSINGMIALVGLLPDRRAGVFVLANLDHAELRHALMYKVFDLYAGNPPRDWSAELKDFFARRSASARPATRPAEAAAPSLPLVSYAGTYVDSTYGTIEITAASAGLRARFGTHNLGVLEPWEHESFRAVGPPPALGRTAVTFMPDGSGGVTAVRVFGVTFQRAPTGRTPPRG